MFLLLVPFCFIRSAPYDEYGAGRVSEYFFGDASHEKTCYSCPSVAAHDDDIAGEFFCEVRDHLVGLALSYERLDFDPLCLRLFPDLFNKTLCPGDESVDRLRGLGLEFFSHVYYRD